MVNLHRLKACMSYFTNLSQTSTIMSKSPLKIVQSENQNSCTALMMTSVVRKRLCTTHIHKSSWHMSINNSLVTAEKYWCLSNLMSFPEEICWFAVLDLGEFSLFLINLIFFLTFLSYYAFVNCILKDHSCHHPPQFFFCR